jgi:hypothetical protein
MDPHGSTWYVSFLMRNEGQTISHFPPHHRGDEALHRLVLAVGFKLWN